MAEGILAALGGLFAIVLKLFGLGEKAAARKKAEAEAVINEVIKYENNVDSASQIRENSTKLDERLETEWRKKFEPPKA